MRSGIDKILRDVQARPYSLKNVPIEALHAIWNGLCAHIHSVLANGKVLVVSLEQHSARHSIITYLGHLELHTRTGSMQLAGSAFLVC
jgi:hypothetical protein